MQPTFPMRCDPPSLQNAFKPSFRTTLRGQSNIRSANPSTPTSPDRMLLLKTEAVQARRNALGRDGLSRLFGADKAYDVTQLVRDLRERSVTPHIASDGLSKTGIPRKTAVDARTIRHAGYEVRRRCRRAHRDGSERWSRQKARLGRRTRRWLA